MPYTPNQSKYLTVAQTRTNRGTKDVKIILDIDTNVFYTLDDDGNFVPIAYSQNSGIFSNIDVTNIANINNLNVNIISGDTFIGIEANEVSFDNSISNLSATTVQDAIDEIDNILDNLDANDISFDNTSLAFSTASNVQQAIVDGDKGLYPVGYYLSFLENFTGLANASIANGSVKGNIVYIQGTVKLDRVRMKVGVAAVSGNCVSGIYKYVSENTWNLVAQANGVFNLTSTLEQEILFPSEVTLEKGIYATVIHLETTTSLLCNTIGAQRNTFGYINQQTSNVRAAFYFNRAYDGTLPTTISAVTASASDGGFYPHLLYKITG